MITSVEAYLKYYEGVHRRTLRDITNLPTAADGWKPPAGEGEKAWGINTIVGHIAGSRHYFLNAYLGEGWIAEEPPDTRRQAEWAARITESFERFAERLAGTPDAWLNRRVPLIDTDGALSGWRILMLAPEHEVHHRSQLDTFAGLNGWDVPQIFGRSAEQIAVEQARERAEHSRAGGGFGLVRPDD